MPDPLRAALVDDEPLGRERVRTLLADEGDVELVGEYATGEEAVAGVAAALPEVLFLDVQMPGIDGFDALELLQQVVTAEDMPAIVFVTAHDQYALRAFDVSAVDYLLKPFDRARFQAALARARARARARRTSGPDGAEWVTGLLEQVRLVREKQSEADAQRVRAEARFVVRSGSKISFVRATDVDWIEGDGNYARLHTRGRSHLVRETLKSVESRLDQHRFVRVHRSAIVNVDCIGVVEPRGHGEYAITMKDGARLTSSRTHSGKLRAMLG